MPLPGSYHGDGDIHATPSPKSEVHRQIRLRVIPGTRIDQPHTEQPIGARGVDTDLRAGTSGAALGIQHAHLKRPEAGLGGELAFHQIVHRIVGSARQGQVEVTVQVEVHPGCAVTRV